MTLLLTLFFISLAGIAVMLGRKLVVVRKEVSGNGIEEELILEIPNLKEMRNSTLKGMKKVGFVALVLAIRIYVKSANMIKNQSKNIVKVIRRKTSKRGKIEVEPEKQEVSSFLKMVSEYKQKVKRIKRRIKEEEKVK